MWARIVNKFRELKRDRRTLAMMIVLPILMLVIFGYAANFSVSKISTVVVGPQAEAVSKQLEPPFHVVAVDPEATKSTAETQLRDNKAVVAVVTGRNPVEILMDGTQLFSVQTAESALGRTAQSAKAEGKSPPAFSTQILYNPDLKTSWVLVPGLAGLIGIHRDAHHEPRGREGAPGRHPRTARGDALSALGHHRRQIYPVEETSSTSS